MNGTQRYPEPSAGQWQQEVEPTQVYPPAPATPALAPPVLAAPNPSTRSDRYPVAQWSHGLLAGLTWLALVGQLLVILTNSLNAKQTGDAVISYVGGLVFLTLLIIAITETSLAANPIRQSATVASMRMASVLLSISVIGIFVAAGPVALPKVNPNVQDPLSILLYLVIPVLLLASYLLLGPRPRFTFGHIVGAVALPVVWAIYVVVHGAITGVYAYAFLNVANGGYVGVIANMLFLTTLLVAIGVGLVFLDRGLPYAPRR